MEQNEVKMHITDLVPPAITQLFFFQSITIQPLQSSFCVQHKLEQGNLQVSHLLSSIMSIRKHDEAQYPRVPSHWSMLSLWLYVAPSVVSLPL